MTLVAPSLAVAGLLDGQTLAAPAPGILLGLGRNLFRGPIRAPTPDGKVPETAVFVFIHGGARPMPYHGESKDRLNAAGTVFVRMSANHFEDGEDLSRAVWRQIHRNLAAAPDGYVEMFCETSEPEFIRTDETQHLLWQINLQVSRVE